MGASPKVAYATITGPTREAIADIASNIPGYGPSDVFYPSWFLGDWQATSELSAVETPQGEALAGEPALRARALVGTPAALERYPQRYIERRGKIIADRAFNARSMVRSSGGSRSVESVEWDPSNPNVLTMTLKKDGASVRTEMRVTLRAVGAPEGREDLFNASEFFQEVIGGGDGSPTLAAAPPAPRVTPVRCVTKFRRVPGPQIQALQRVEVFSVGGPESGARDFGELLRGSGAGPDPGKPVAVYRYRGVLVPIEDTATVSQAPTGTRPS